MISFNVIHYFKWFQRIYFRTIIDNYRAIVKCRHISNALIAGRFNILYRDICEPICFCRRPVLGEGSMRTSPLTYNICRPISFRATMLRCTLQRSRILRTLWKQTIRDGPVNPDRCSASEAWEKRSDRKEWIARIVILLTFPPLTRTSVRATIVALGWKIVLFIRKVYVNYFLHKIFNIE